MWKVCVRFSVHDKVVAFAWFNLQRRTLHGFHAARQLQHLSTHRHFFTMNLPTMSISQRLEVIKLWTYFLRLSSTMKRNHIKWESEWQPLKIGRPCCMLSHDHNVVIQRILQLVIFESKTTCPPLDPQNFCWSEFSPNKTLCNTAIWWHVYNRICKAACTQICNNTIYRHRPKH